MSNIKLWIISCAMIASVLILWFFADIVLLFLVSGAIAFVLTPPVDYLQRVMKTKGRALAVFIVALCVIALLFALFSVILPMLISQVRSLIANIGTYADDISQVFSKFILWLEGRGLSPSALETIAGLIDRLEDAVINLATAFGMGVLNFSLKLPQLFISLIIVVYLMLDGKKIFHAFVSLFPPNGRIRVNRIGHEMNLLVWSYLRQRIVISTGMFTVTLIGFLSFGLEYALLLAFITFLLDFIPYFGSIIAAIIAVASAFLSGGWVLAFWVLIFVLLVQQLEGNVISPLLQAKTVDVHPVAVIFSLLACSRLWGVFGMFIAVPVVGIVKILCVEIRDLYRSVDRPGGFGSTSDAPLVSIRIHEGRLMPLLRAFIQKVKVRCTPRSNGPEHKPEAPGEDGADTGRNTDEDHDQRDQ